MGSVSGDVYVHDSVLGLLVSVLVLLGLIVGFQRLEKSFKATSNMYINCLKTKMICILVFFNYHTFPLVSGCVPLSEPLRFKLDPSTTCLVIISMC